MPGFFTLVVIGFVAQLIDGSLGMAYGVSTSTLMLSVGLVPALASASIHLAELGTTASSALSHWRFGNVDRGKVLWLGLPGAVAAFFGAVALSSFSAQAARPWVAVILAVLGIHILIRFAFRSRTKPVVERPIAQRFLVPLGLVAGFMDALGGGGWGPIATPTLLASGRMQPARVVGTVDTSEFLVALGASAGFLLALDFRHVPWVIVGALLLGGVVAAPVAAYLVRLVPVRIMGTAVGGLILITNARTLLAAWSLPADG
ncbi:MAG TPA: sulfite exporter TauE/SafE family protein, partial [Bacillota bacterium]